MAAARFVLLHSPLLGPLTWRPVAAELERRGHEVETPAWPRLGQIADGFYEALATGLAAQLGGEGPRLLVAHSGAGALAPTLGRKLSEPPAGLIFADAILPHPGRSWLAAAPAELRDQLRAGARAGELPAWDQWWPPGALERLVPDAAVREALTGELDPLPLAYFEAAAPEGDVTSPAAYLQLSGAYDDEAVLAGRYGWPVVRLPLHHLAMLTDPAPVAAALESLALRLRPDAHG